MIGWDGIHRVVRVSSGRIAVLHRGECVPNFVTPTYSWSVEHAPKIFCEVGESWIPIMIANIWLHDASPFPLPVTPRAEGHRAASLFATGPTHHTSTACRPSYAPPTHNNGTKHLPVRYQTTKEDPHQDIIVSLGIRRQRAGSESCSEHSAVRIVLCRFQSKISY